jgi:hypothetical protein
MAKILENKYANPVFVVLAILFISSIWYFMYKNDSRQNDKICEMKAMTLKGVIAGTTGHGSYNYIEVDNAPKSIRLSISETKYRKGFAQDYTYSKGDSIIKQAGSGEFTIKRGKNITVHSIGCDD